MLERRIKESVRRGLNAAGVFNVCYIPGEPGMPDRVCCLPVEITGKMVGKKIGVFVGIEIKARKK